MNKKTTKTSKTSKKSKSTKINKTTKNTETKKVKEISSNPSEPKEATLLGTRTYSDEKMNYVETAKRIDHDTDVFTTPWGIKANAQSLVEVLEQLYALSKEDREKEKPAWIEVLGNLLGKNKEGFDIADVIFADDGSRNVKFVYRNEIYEK